MPSIATTLVSVSPNQTQLVVLVPAAEGAQLSVTVTVGDRSSTAVGVVSFAPPTILSVSPSASGLKTLDSITIAGTDFGASARVLIAGALCTATSQSATLIVCTIPQVQYSKS